MNRKVYPPLSFLTSYRIIFHLKCVLSSWCSLASQREYVEEPPTAELQTKGKTPADVLKQLGMKL